MTTKTKDMAQRTWTRTRTRTGPGLTYTLAADPSSYGLEIGWHLQQDTGRVHHGCVHTKQVRGHKDKNSLSSPQPWRQREPLFVPCMDSSQWIKSGTTKGCHNWRDGPLTSYSFSLSLSSRSHRTRHSTAYSDLFFLPILRHRSRTSERSNQQRPHNAHDSL
jgi:hypothetical protein